MPRLRSAFPLACASVIALVAACGGSVANTNDGGGHSGNDGGGGGDSGRPPPGDAGVDAKKGDAVAPDGGCSSCPSDAGGHDASTEVPTNHRPDDSQCATVPAAGTCSVMFMGAMCTSDSDCTTGTNGRCIESNGGAIYCSCTYDTCATDTDCPNGQLCACHGSVYSDGNGNTCVPGNCRVDSDCGAGGYCSPSGGGGCGGLLGYYCHTPEDTCVNDSDCTSEGIDDCEWSTTDARWECTMEELCG